MAWRAWTRGVAGTLCIHNIYSHVLHYVDQYKRNAERTLTVAHD